MDKKMLRIAENVLLRLAQRDGVTVEYIRKQMQIAMLNGLASTDPQIKAYWARIPREGAVPTPEELVVYTAGLLRGDQ